MNGVDHGQTVLAAIVPSRRDLLLIAFQHLEPVHFVNEVQRNLFVMLERYYTIAADIMPPKTLTDLLNRTGTVDASKRLLYEQTYAALVSTEIPDHEFRYSVDALKELRADKLTGEAITTSFEIKERGVEIEGEEIRGHAAARRYLMEQVGDIDKMYNREEAPEGDIRKEGAALLAEYHARKSGQAVSGVFTGIPEIDRATDGFGNGELSLVCAYTGEGKMAALDTPVLTPTGWTTMGALRVGDAIVNSAGERSEVTALFPQGVKPLYRVSFSDGSSTECGLEHLWTVQDNNQRNNVWAGGRRYSREEDRWEVVDTEAAMKRLAAGDRLYIPMVAPVQFEAAEPEIDAYTFGALLGDGSFAGSVTFTNMDEEIIERVTDGAGLLGATVVQGSKPKDHRINGREIRDVLRRLGVWGARSWEKHIPDGFLYGSVSTRLEVLRGLMDTDGTVDDTGRRVEFCTSSEQLADGVRHLVESLGGTAKISRHVHSYVHKGVRVEARDRYRVRPKLPEGINPFFVARKADRYSRRLEGVKQGDRLLPFRRITRIEFSREAEAQCLMTSAPDRLYVTDSFILTHNSQLVTQIAWHAAVHQGKNVFFATSETLRAQVRRRMVARHSRLERFGLEHGLNARGIKQGSLTETEEQALGAVLDDLDTNPAYGRMEVAQIPSGGTLSYVAARMARAQQQWNIDLVVIDYLALLKNERNRTSEREEFNEIIRSAKTLAASFDAGRGVPVISPWQMKQAKYEDALRTGEYTLASLSDTSEAEKSADQIVTLLGLPDTPEMRRVKFLKVRDGDLPPSFDLAVDYRNAYIGSRRAGTSAADDVESLLHV